MVYTVLFWLVIICLVVIGYKLITQGFTIFKKRRRVIFRRATLSDIYKYISDKESKHNIKDFFKHTALPINARQYITYRLLILAVFAVLTLLYIGFTDSDPLILILLYIFVVYISLPRHTFLGIKTPMSILVNYLKVNYLRIVEQELFRILTVLKNLIITCMDKPVSAEYIINNLVEFSNLTKPVFIEFLSLYRLNRIDEAYTYFVNEVGTPIGEDFASILIKLDDIEPANLIEQLELYQSAIRDQCMTERIKRDKIVSDIAFFPVIVSVFLILLNFIFISLYIEGMNTFYILFG